MSPVILITAGIGLLVGSLIRGAIFTYSVPPTETWHRDCPHCHQALAPAARWLPLALAPTGRCRHCRRRIGPAPAVIEVTAGAVFGLLAWRTASPLPLLAFCWMATFALALAFTDVAVHRLPDRLNVPALAGGLVLLAATAAVRNEPGRLVTAILCAAGVAVLYLALAMLPRGYGLGDVKIGLLVGLAAGWYGPGSAIIATLAGFLLAGVVAIVIALRHGTRRDLPHGPFMLLGALVAVMVHRI